MTCTAREINANRGLPGWVLVLCALLLTNGANAKSESTVVSVTNDNVGTLKMTLPEKWQGTATKDDLTGASVYEIVSKKEKFRLKIEFSYLGQDDRDESLGLDEYINQRLSNYMAYRLPEFADVPENGSYDVQSFGPAGHGQYARLPNPDKARGAFPYLTHGARIVGNTIVVFTLYSTDQDRSVLARTLDVASSIEADNEIASFVGSYSCRSEHRLGFVGRNAVWIPDIVDVVDQKFLVRTSSEGDQFAAISSWVFVEPGRMRATSWCDDALVEKGRFVCHGASDEEFRMDTSTLRFVYVQLEGYYDVAEGKVLEKDEATPFMDIGICERSER